MPIPPATVDMAGEPTMPPGPATGPPPPGIIPGPAAALVVIPYMGGGPLAMAICAGPPWRPRTTPWPTPPGPGMGIPPPPGIRGFGIMFICFERVLQYDLSEEEGEENDML